MSIMTSILFREKEELYQWSDSRLKLKHSMQKISLLGGVGLTLYMAMILVISLEKNVEEKHLNFVDIEYSNN